jgi:hypothetical protein
MYAEARRRFSRLLGDIGPGLARRLRLSFGVHGRLRGRHEAGLRLGKEIG